MHVLPIISPPALIFCQVCAKLTNGCSACLELFKCCQISRRSFLDKFQKFFASVGQKSAFRCRGDGDTHCSCCCRSLTDL